METKNIFNYKNIYFIGIGGISMSGLCEILLEENFFNIKGSDINDSILIKKLQDKGVIVNKNHNKENITKDIDLVIYTAAIKEDNEEFIKAKELGLNMMERSLFLGRLMLAYKYPICIAGTHGKTTTSSFVSEIFLKAKKDPTISIGGILSSIESNFKTGAKDFFILEACEYCDSFLKFNPHSAIILNIEEDHLDYFKDINQIYDSFKKFANLVPKDGALIINSDIKNYEYIIKDAKCNIITYGQNKADWQALDITFEDGFASYKAYFKGKYMLDIKLNILGFNNIYNSLAALAICSFYNIEKQYVQDALSNFKGVKRRFEYKGEFNKIKVIDDYAHHPTEIISTINDIKKLPYKNLWCVFQPHTYTRTKALFKEFIESFKNAQNIIIMDIYAAREKDTKEISSKDLVDELKKQGKNAFYIKTFEEGVNIIKKNSSQGDIVVTIGAGDIYLLGEMLLNN